MTGHRTTRPDAAAGRPSSPRVRFAAIAAAVLSVAVCGAVAQATGGGADPEWSDVKISAPERGVAKAEHKPVDVAAAAAPSSTEVEGEAIPPDGLGDDADLNGLAEACFGGDLVACDQLYLQSPVGSEFETYGDTCAGRQAAGTSQWCGIGSAPGPAGPTGGEPVPPDGLGSDPELDALAQACYGGEMQSCDDLYAASEAGSAYENYGDTCAGRQPEGTGRYCTALEDVVPGTGAVATTSPVTSTTSFDDTTSSTEAITTEPTDSVPQGSIPAPTVEPTGLGDDSMLDALAQSCYDGDMSACDDLYRGSEPDTAYRSYGDTCAGRQPEGTGSWCVDSFGGAMPTDVPTTSGPSPTSTTLTVPVPPVTTAPPVTTPPVVTTVPPPTVSTSMSQTPTTTSAGTIPPPTLEPVGLGTDPALDALAQACFAGDMISCDDLWRQSETGSAYRDYGDTCAGRQELGTGVWCEDSFSGVPLDTTSVPVTAVPPSTDVTPTTLGGVPPAPQEPTGLGADPVLDALAQACFVGDMQSCDDLFDSSPVGSAYMAYGDTCAGRQQPGTFNYCRVVFPSTPRQ